MVRSAVPLAGSSGRERYGFLEHNFDRSLMELFSEVHYWERLHYEIPYAAMDIAAHRERYRCLALTLTPTLTPTPTPTPTLTLSLTPNPHPHQVPLPAGERHARRARLHP